MLDMLALLSKCRRRIATTVCLLFHHQLKLSTSFMRIDRGYNHNNPLSQVHNRIFQRIQRHSSSLGEEHQNDNNMDMVHREWSVEDDDFLFMNYKSKGAEYVATKLGRGVGGVEKRWSKITTVKSNAYQRLFSKDDDDDTDEKEHSYLIPVQEVLQRIQWDPTLETSDFTIWYKDRYHTSDIMLLLSTPFDAPNLTVKGKEPLFVKAIPSHRIMAIQYKSDYILWDREARSSPNLDNNNFVQIYPQWKQQRTEEYQQLLKSVESILFSNQNDDHYQALKENSSSLVQRYKDENVSITQDDLDQHVQQILQIFRSALDEYTDISEEVEINDDEIDVKIPTSDIESLQIYMQLVSYLPFYDLRQQLTRTIDAFISQEIHKESSTAIRKNDPKELPTIVEEELEETFVRGSGSGGQKINKTSNRVILVHKPTKVRVECQDTRSLQQNRKIARKRLRAKLDEFYNGSTSRKALAQQKVKKKKQRARSKAKKKHNKSSDSSED